jgi:hypothetical protein
MSRDAGSSKGSQGSAVQHHEIADLRREVTLLRREQRKLLSRIAQLLDKSKPLSRRTEPIVLVQARIRGFLTRCVSDVIVE